MDHARAHDNAKVTFWMPADLKSEVEEAAVLVGASFTSFATEVLAERAREVKREYGLSMLDETERDAFLEMLANPPKPSAALVKLMNTQVAL